MEADDAPARFYFDLGSPYAWLAAERIEQALYPVEWRPVLLGGIFAATGRSSWARTDAREDGMREVERRADAYGLPAVVWPPEWPNDGLLAMRAAAAAARLGHAREYALAAFRLSFTRGLMQSDPDTVAAAAKACGLDPQVLVEEATSPDGKADLRRRTEAAIADGVSGAPTTLVGGRLYWGDDALDRAIADANRKVDTKSAAVSPDRGSIRR